MGTVRTIDDSLELLYAEKLASGVDEKAPVGKGRLVLDHGLRQDPQAPGPPTGVVPPDRLREGLESVAQAVVRLTDDSYLE